MKTFKYVLFALIPVFIAPIILLNEFVIYPIISLFLLVIDIGILIVFYTKRYYNVFFFLIALITLGIFFKRQHFPGAGVMLTLGALISAVCFFILGIKSLSQFKKNRFLRWFGFFVNIVFSICFTGFIFKMQHWPGGNIFVICGTILYVLSILVFVFTLPGSNYLEWNKLSKKFFYRVIILPMIWLFIMTALVNAFPETWNKLTSWEYASDAYWQMYDYTLEDKEGLK